jgi:hypothetical protein
MPSEVSPLLVAATTSDPSRSWFIILSYTDRRKKNSNKLMKFRLHMLGRRGDHLRTPLNNPHRRARGCPRCRLGEALTAPSFDRCALKRSRQQPWRTPEMVSPTRASVEVCC